MTALLTPVELNDVTFWVNEAFKTPFPGKPAEWCRDLLRDREAICERHRALEAKLAKVRELRERITGYPSIGVAHRIRDELTAILENQS